MDKTQRSLTTLVANLINGDRSEEFRDSREIIRQREKRRLRLKDFMSSPNPPKLSSRSKFYIGVKTQRGRVHYRDMAFNMYVTHYGSEEGPKRFTDDVESDKFRGEPFKTIRYGLREDKDYSKVRSQSFDFITPEF